MDLRTPKLASGVVTVVVAPSGFARAPTQFTQVIADRGRVGR
jgi:hypothetical protein